MNIIYITIFSRKYYFYIKYYVIYKTKKCITCYIFFEIEIRFSLNFLTYLLPYSILDLVVLHLKLPRGGDVS